MNRVATDELSRMDEAFAGNQLLATFPTDVRTLIEPFAEIIELAVGDPVQKRGQDVTHSVFPFGETMVSMVLELQPNRLIEVASIGREGAVGGIVSCGQTPAFSDAKTHNGGRALRVPMHAMEDGKRRSPFLANLFCRYSDFLLSQVMQSVACNAFHGIEERAARWLLTAQDRAGDRIELTQETLAGLLGVQRTTLNAAVQRLQEADVIAIRRGAIIVLDSAKLKARSCQCHSVLERHFAAVIGPGGAGGIDSKEC